MDPTNANMLPEATQDDIIKEFEVLVGSSAEVTTLDVKESLRGKNFWVNQGIISKTIWDFVRNNPKFDIDYVAGHRVYSLASSGSVAVAGTIKPPVVIGDWEIAAPDGTTKLYTNTTRNKARYEFSKEYNIPYAALRSRKA